VSEPRIVLFDLETLVDLREVLKVFPAIGNYPGLTLRAQLQSVICFGYKVFGENGVHCQSAWDYRSWVNDVNDDRELCEFAYEILKDADAVVTHNGKKFDWKFLQTRLSKHGLPALPKIKHVDTRQESSRNLFLFNNKLDNIGQYLLGDKKLDHEGWELWVKVHGRDAKAMATMADYCKQDVLLLEKAFRKLRPFVRDIPNHNLFVVGGSRNLCPACGSTRIKKNGHRYNQTMSYQRYLCLDCGTASRTDSQDRMPRSI